MRAFAPTLLAYFAAVSATVLQVNAVAIPRDSEDVAAAGSPATTQDPSIVVVNDDGARPRWAFVTPGWKRTTKVCSNNIICDYVRAI